MPKESGQSLKVVRGPARPQPSRQILHGFGTPAGPRLEPRAQGAAKRFDGLKPSPASPKRSDGKPKPQMVY